MHNLGGPAVTRAPRRAGGLRVGLLGGSFNPAHEGHLHISRLALDHLGLDELWWLVSPRNPLKPARGMASFDERLAGARTVAADPRDRDARPRPVRIVAATRPSIHGQGAAVINQPSG